MTATPTTAVPDLHAPDLHAPGYHAPGLGPRVRGLFTSGKHSFTKYARTEALFLAGLGIEGDCHCGATVRHRWDMRKDPTKANLKQVHLLASEILDELNGSGFHVEPGDLGENVSTSGIDLAALPERTRLHIGPAAIVEITGLRQPCTHIEKFQRGLLAAVLTRSSEGKVIRKAGIMGVVTAGGPVALRDKIVVEWPPAPHLPLRPV